MPAPHPCNFAINKFLFLIIYDLKNKIKICLLWTAHPHRFEHDISSLVPFYLLLFSAGDEDREHGEQPAKLVLLERIYNIPASPLQQGEDCKAKTTQKKESRKKGEKTIIVIRKYKDMKHK